MLAALAALQPDTLPVLPALLRTAATASAGGQAAAGALSAAEACWPDDTAGPESRTASTSIGVSAASLHSSVTAAAMAAQLNAEQAQVLHSAAAWFGPKREVRPASLRPPLTNRFICSFAPAQFQCRPRAGWRCRLPAQWCSAMGRMVAGRQRCWCPSFACCTGRCVCTYALCSHMTTDLTTCCNQTRIVPMQIVGLSPTAPLHGGRILVAAHTNTAVDRVLIGLKDSGFTGVFAGHLRV